ncbi:hypothetical protein BDZ91DRAFT_648413 [Kalaharituber pfeilii]|nr:hypothetical protein BDZ91DRAFT_648413 [Kalaharituber pfeilii]
MQFSTITLALLSGASLASAHFSVTYPWWRGDSFSTQWTYPCGGVNQSISANNRTKWPLDGGSLVFRPSHDWAQTYVNLGLGNNVTRLNIPLVTPFNQTGKGTFCFKKIPIPESIKSNITEGVNATVQVIQLSTSGGALYNCADITFSADAQTPGDDVCFNSTGVGAANLDYPDVVPEESAGVSLKGGVSALAVMAAVAAAGLIV